MMRKHVKVLLVCLLLFLMMLSVAACDSKENNPTENPNSPDIGQVEDDGIIKDIPDDVTVSLGDVFDFSLAAIMIDDTVLVPQEVKVVFGESEEVTTQNKSFTATKIGTYTLTYKFVYGDETYTYTSKVTVANTEKPALRITEGSLPMYAMMNEEITLPTFAATDVVDGKLDVQVRVYRNDANKTPVTVTNGKFTVSSYDDYVVTATATNTAELTATETYTVAVRQALTNPMFDGFEQDKAGAIVGTVRGTANVSVSEEVKHSGNKALKVENGKVSRWTFVQLRLAPDMLEQIDETSELSLWVYIAAPASNATLTGFNLRFTNYNPASNDGLGDWPEGNENSVATGQWHKLTFKTDASGDNPLKRQMLVKENGGITLYVEVIDSNNRYSDMVFTYYVDDIAISKPNADVKLDVQDITKKFAEGQTVELADLSDTAKFSGITDTSKLTITDGNGTPISYTIEGYKVKYTPSAAGIYTFIYTYKSGAGDCYINTATQTVNLQLALADPAFDGFEGGAHASVGKIRNNNASVCTVSSDMHYGTSGSKALKIQNGEWSSYSFIELKLHEDMLAYMKEHTDAELSFRYYISQKNSNISSFTASFATFVESNGDWNGEYAQIGGQDKDVAMNTWHWVVFQGATALQEIRTSGSIRLWLQVHKVSESEKIDFTYYVDDLKVTLPYSSIPTSVDKDNVTVKATENEPLEIADFSALSGFEDNNLTVFDGNGNAIAHTKNNGKVYFAPSVAGTYGFIYVYSFTMDTTVYTNIVKQTITIKLGGLSNPLFDGFEESDACATVGTIKGTATTSISSEVTHGESSKALKVVNGTASRWTFVPLMLAPDMIDAIDETCELSLWVYIASGSSIPGFNLRLYNYDKAKAAEGKDPLGEWATEGNENSVATGQWHKLTFKTDSGDNPLKRQMLVKDNGGITLYIELAGDMPSDLTFTYYVDDITITKAA